MGCCGQGRAALAGSSATGGRELRHSRPSGGGGRPGINLRYVGGRSVRVRGTATGKPYFFAGAGVQQMIDVGDVPALLRTGLFTRS
jgi:hypothetical protein